MAIKMGPIIGGVKKPYLWTLRLEFPAFPDFGLCKGQEDSQVEVQVGTVSSVNVQRLVTVAWMLSSTTLMMPEKKKKKMTSLTARFPYKKGRR